MATDGRLENWIEDLANLEDAPARADFFARRAELRTRETLEHLSQEVLKYARQDLPRAERLALAGRWLADDMDDDRGRAISLKSFGNISYLAGEYDQALELYQNAATRFHALGAELDAAVTLSNAIHAQILLGRYPEALGSAREARKIFQGHGERLLLARLDSNEAQIYVRQGRQIA